jgi:hypothetical protein
VIDYLPPPLGDFQASWKHGDAEARWVGSGRDLEVTSVWTPARWVSVYIL